MRNAEKIKLLWDIFFTFFKISPVSFGGGYAMIPLLERAVTTDKKWVKQKVIADILVMGQTIPGSIAVNTATFIGYRLSGVAGAIVGWLGSSTRAVISSLLLSTRFLIF